MVSLEEDALVTVYQKSLQVITCMIERKEGKGKFLLSAIYVFNSQVRRQELWQQINGLKNDTPWLLMGDFNCIRFGHEKIGGDLPDTEAMDEFNNCIHDMELDNLKWWGQ